MTLKLTFFLFQIRLVQAVPPVRLAIRRRVKMKRISLRTVIKTKAFAGLEHCTSSLTRKMRPQGRISLLERFVITGAKKDDPSAMTNGQGKPQGLLLVQTFFPRLRGK